MRPDPSTSETPKRAAPPVLLTRHADRLDAVPGGLRDLVLLLRDDVPATTNAFAERWPAARIHVLGARRGPTQSERAQLRSGVRWVGARSLQQRLDYLLRIERPQVILEAGNRKRAHKLSSFRQLFFFVQPGGCYIAEDLAACQHPRYDDGTQENLVDLLTEVAAVVAGAPGPDVEVRGFVRELAAAAGGVAFADHAAVVDRTGERLYAKLRDWEADAVLTARYGHAWGRVLTTRPGFTFTSRADVTSHGEGPIPSGKRTYEVPDRYLRRYCEVVCTNQQIVRYGDYLLPDSWRHPHQRTLSNRQLAQTSPYVAGYLKETNPTSYLRHPGAFYYFDSELPGHFGHVTTDVLSRVWGWQQAVAEDPTVRPLVSNHRIGGFLHSFQKEIFAALGIPLDRALVVQPREAVEVETLYGATPQLENPHYVDPDLGNLWRELGEKLPPGRPSTADKIFVSRKPSDKRHCREAPDVEAFFASHGFAVIYPEDHPYADQKMIFERARVIAGFGGSGMFNMMFAPHATVVLISGHSYNAENEHLIAAVNGNELHYFWGRSDIAMPGKFSPEAFRSGFSFDLQRHRSALRRAIR